jgi:arylsulfatase A-like enzyme
MRIFRTVTALFFIGVLFSCHPQDQKPNILFIMSDDHAFQAVSAYEDRLAEVAPTPNIDRIFENGMRFDRCFVTNSICGPSRATILTGKYSHLNGFTENEKTKFDGSQMTFPKLLQSAGYQTAMIGKWHLDSEPTGFDFWDILPGQGNYYNPDFINPEGQYRVEGYVTDIITQKTLAWLAEAQQNDQPFMLMMHHKAPHRAWEPEPEFFDRFKDVVFPEPETLFDDYSNRGRAEKEQAMMIQKDMQIETDLKMWTDTTVSRFQWFANRLNDEQLKQWNAHYLPMIESFREDNPQGDDLVRFKYQRYMNDYLACIQSVDASVGAVLDYLKASGLDENTIVVYTSDQGFYLGEHGWFDKRFMFEESLRTPLVVSWPGKIRPGTVNNNMVSNLDFAETFLDAAGVKIPEEMQGRSLVPVLKGKTPNDWRKAHYYHYYEYPGWHSVKRHYGITTDRYKLIHFYYDIDEWELFDLEKDPNEMRNVYHDPAYAEIRKDLHEQLDRLMEQYGDSDELARSMISEE